MNKNVMVFIELNRGKMADVSLELICEAGRIAARLGADVEAVAAGYGAGEELIRAGQYGCARVFYTDDPRLSFFSSVPFAGIVCAAIQKYRPRIVLFGATAMGRDVAPRVASALRCGLTADCTKLEIGNYRIKDKVYEDILLQIRPAFGGNIIATIVSPDSLPSMATVREGVMKKNDPDLSGRAQIVWEPCVLGDEDFLTEMIEAVHGETSVNLKSAKIIVSAGMGAADPESLSLVSELAKTIGGVLGSSRPVVDAGLLDRRRQVGQTGTTVRPNLYIACGISGQIQHRAGMEGSRRIVAINRDPEAPIFQIAHYGIVGDVRDVIPRMIKAYKAFV
jgi:electron transfer flavoprotein alpha subunit